MSRDIRVLLRVIDSLGYKVAISNGRLVRIDSLLIASHQNINPTKEELRQYKNTPILDIRGDGGPIIKSNYKGIPNCLLFVVDEIVEGAVAANVEPKVAVIGVDRNDSIYHYTVRKVIAATTRYIVKERPMTAGVELGVNKMSTDSKAYACIKIFFTDNNNISQKPLIRVYISTGEIDVPLKEIGNQEEYDRVLKYLKQKKF